MSKLEEYRAAIAERRLLTEIGQESQELNQRIRELYIEALIEVEESIEYDIFY